MKPANVTTLVGCLIIFAVVASLAWLSIAPKMPAQEKVEQTISDARIPR